MLSTPFQFSATQWLALAVGLLGICVLSYNSTLEQGSRRQKLVALFGTLLLFSCSAIELLVTPVAELFLWLQAVTLGSSIFALFTSVERLPKTIAVLSLWALAVAALVSRGFVVGPIEAVIILGMGVLGFGYGHGSRAAYFFGGVLLAIGSLASFYQTTSVSALIWGVLNLFFTAVAFHSWRRK